MNTRTVLVIEEESGLRQLFADVLALGGIEVNGYASPEAYYQANGGCWCQHDPYPCHDFMLIDKCMPNMSGFDFLHKLEEQGCQLNSQRKAITSGDLTADDLHDAVEGGYKVLNKPCHMGTEGRSLLFFYIVPERKSSYPIIPISYGNFSELRVDSLS